MTSVARRPVFAFHPARIRGVVCSTRERSRVDGGVPEWLKGADCKSAGVSLRRFESFLHHSGLGRVLDGRPVGKRVRGCSSVGRASAFQAEGRGFESRRPLARVAQLVERVLGKDEVSGSIPLASFDRRLDR